MNSHGEDTDATIQFIEGEDCECTPYVLTIDFYDEEMDGIWWFVEEEDWYRLNRSDNDEYYVMKFSDEDYRWDIYAISITEGNQENEWSDALMFCWWDALSNCPGNWKVFDSEVADWVYDLSATSMRVDCAYASAECDVVGLGVEETSC